MKFFYISLIFNIVLYSVLPNLSLNGVTKDQYFNNYDLLYTSVESIAKKYTRPITVLDLSGTNGVISFKLAQQFSDSVFIVINEESSLLNTCISYNLKNITLLNKKLSLQDLKILGECEHFDIIVAGNNILKLLDKNYEDLLHTLFTLGEKFFIEVPRFYSNFENINVLLNKISSKQIYTPLDSTIYFIEFVKSKIQRRSWVFPLPAETIKKYSIVSDYHQKYLSKPRGNSILKCNWLPGINLVTFKILEGVYPVRDTLITEIANLKNITHSDCQAHNLIIQGQRIKGIDTHDPLQPVGQFTCQKAQAYLLGFIQTNDPHNYFKKSIFFHRPHTHLSTISLNNLGVVQRKAVVNPALTDNEALKYVMDHNNAYICISFPCIKPEELVIEKILSKHGNIIYKKYVELKNNGSINLIRECYKYDGHSQSHLQALHDAIFSNKEGTIIVYVYECKNLETVRTAKKEVRDYFKIKCAIHATDTHTQSIDLAKILLTKNSIHFLNYRNASASSSYSTFNKLFSQYKDMLKGIDDACVVDGSAILSAYGLRDCNDLDYLCLEGINFIKEYPNINNHRTELRHHQNNLDNLISNPNNFFYYNNVKFLSLKQIYTMKQNRYKTEKNPKDLKDLNLIFPLLQ